MVNNMKNLSRYDGTPPITETTERVKISGGPLYESTVVLEILNTGESAVIPWTEKCIRDLKKLTFEKADVVELLKFALQHGKFKGSEWCLNKSGGAWAACDSYQVFRNEWIAKIDKYLEVEYYVKFAIGKSGKLVLTISCHTPENK